MKSSEKYFNQVKKIHNKYDYSLSIYNGSLSKIKIICPEHGVFEQRADSHLKGRGCKKCSDNKYKLKNKEILIKLNKSNIKYFNNKYDYSLVDYINTKSKIKIICPEHGEFEQRVDHHLNGHGCPICSKNKKYTKEEFIKKSDIIHNNKYNYSLVDYINNHTKINIICPIHGKFEQIPSNHLSLKRGCPRCNGFKILNINDFIKKSNIIHNNTFDYSLVKYINIKTKVQIMCKKHGIFNQSPDNHLNGQGCPKCNKSKGEIIISNILDDLNIKYTEQYKLYDENTKHPLRADFYLPNYNTIIEYNGIQHYEKIEYFGGLDI